MVAPALKRKFGFTRLEIFLGLGVVLGLLYMVFLFGFSTAPLKQRDLAALSRTAQESLNVVIARQEELDRQVRDLEALLRKMGQSDRKGLAELRGELERLSNALDLVEARLGEISRLFPQPPKKQD